MRLLENRLSDRNRWMSLPSRALRVGVVALALNTGRAAAADVPPLPVLPLEEVKAKFTERLTCKFGKPESRKTSGDYVGAPPLVRQQIYPCGKSQRTLVDYYTVPSWPWEKEKYLRSKVEFERTRDKQSDSFYIWFQRKGEIEQIVWFVPGQHLRKGERYELWYDQRLTYAGNGTLVIREDTVIRADHIKKSASFTTRRRDPVSGKVLSEESGDWEYDQLVCPESNPHCRD